VSKLKDTLKAGMTGRREAIPMRYVTVSYNKLPTIGPSDGGFRDVYEFGAQIATRFSVSPGPHRDEQLAEAKRAASRQIMNEVFGEYRVPLMDAIVAVSYGAPKAGVTILKTLYEDMFGAL
jgi:hypothetical protein